MLNAETLCFRKRNVWQKTFRCVIRNGVDKITGHENPKGSFRIDLSDGASVKSRVKDEENRECNTRAGDAQYANHFSDKISNLIVKRAAEIACMDLPMITGDQLVRKVSIKLKWNLKQCKWTPLSTGHKSETLRPATQALVKKSTLKCKRRRADQLTNSDWSTNRGQGGQNWIEVWKNATKAQRRFVARSIRPSNQSHLEAFKKKRLQASELQQAWNVDSNRS